MNKSEGTFAAKPFPGNSSEENLRFRKLIENSHDGITLLDNNFNIIYRSHSAERIVGWKTENRIAKNITDVVHADCLDRIRQCLAEILLDPAKSKTCVFRTKHSAGHYIWLEGIFTNFLNDPDILSIVCNFRDITDKKKDDEQLQQAMQELLAYKYALDESAIVAITDQKGVIQYVNNYFCRIAQYSREEMIGQDHRIINSSYHDKAYIRNLWTTIAKGKIWKGEFRNQAKDGSYYWVDTTVVPFLNEKGKPYKYLSIRWDITAQKKVIAALQESETRYSNLFHLSPLPMWIYAIDTLQFLTVNQATIRHYGYTRKEFMSLTVMDISSRAEISKINKIIVEARKRPTYYRRKSLHKKKNQEIINVEIYSNVIDYKGQNAIIVVVNDITERLKQLKAIQAHNRKLQEICWEQSHLVRAPLARIKGLTPLIAAENESAAEKEQMHSYLSQSVDELDRIIAKIVDKSSRYIDRSSLER